MTSSSTLPAANACRITSAPPPMETSPPPAAVAARASASSSPETNVNPASGAGWSSGRWVSTTSGPGNGLVPPHAPAASYIPRPTTPAATVETSSSKNSLSGPCMANSWPPS